MNLRIELYQDRHREQWDAFVAQSRNGTFFHTRRFLSYHPAGRFNDASLLFFDGERIAGLLPAAVVEDGGKKFLVSHPGASYGGLVLQQRGGMADTGDIMMALLAHAKACGFTGIRFLRLTPPSVRAQFSDDQEYWLYQKGCSLSRFEMDGTIPLEGMREADMLPSLDGKCRNMVRQAERSSMTVSVSEDFASFWPILEATLAGRHGAHPTHTLAEIERLHALAPQDVRLFCAMKDKIMIGGIVVVTLNTSALYTLYMAQDYAHQTIHPMHLILTEVMRTGIREGRGMLHVGVSTEDGGTKVNPGLFFFKESFGCRSVRRESWGITF